MNEKLAQWYSGDENDEFIPYKPTEATKEAATDNNVVVIKTVDMTKEMQEHVIDISIQGIEKFSVEDDIAAFIKKEFDKKYKSTWHCIVGRNFGSEVTHKSKHLIHFFIHDVGVLLFKSV